MRLVFPAAVAFALATGAFVLAPHGASAQDEIPPLQGKTEKLARDAGAAVVGLGESIRDKLLKGRLTRRPSTTEQLDGQCGGAGFVIDEEGDILTAAAVVEGQNKVDVTFPGGHKAKAKVLSRDDRNHVALLRLDDPKSVAKVLGGKLPVLALGKSSELKRGRIVATVGNTFDSLQTDGVPSFSIGVVSALGRVRDPDVYKGYAIETDAAVNPGSFGGPLIDLDGRVVGVVVEAISPKRWLGVAVPIDQVALELDDMKAGKQPKTPWLGLSVLSAGEPTLEGVQVADVDDAGPAAKAGLRKGDRLATIDGAKIAEAFDIEHELSQLAPGAPIELGIVREGKSQKVVATLAGVHNENVALAPPREDGRTSTTAPGKPYAGLNAKDDGGAVVSQVVEDGPAAKAGIKVGDKIISVDGTAVKTRQDLIDAISSRSPGQKLLLKVEREGWKKELELTLGTKQDKAPAGDKGDKPEKKPAKRAFLGLQLAPSDDEDALVVAAVVPNSPAAKAKLQVGDLVKEIDGKKLGSPEDFRALIGGHGAGDTIKITLVREGKESKLDVTLGERPADLQPRRDPSGNDDKPKGPEKAWIGVAFEEKGGKIVVDDIAEEGPAARAKVAKGLVLVGVKTESGVQKFENIDALAKWLDARKVGDSVTLVFEKEGWTKTVDITMEPRPEGK